MDALESGDTNAFAEDLQSGKVGLVIFHSQEVLSILVPFRPIVEEAEVLF